MVGDFGDVEVFSFHATKFVNSRRRARISQLVSDLGKKPASVLSVLDLGCREGHYSFEFAAKGASVLGIERRKCNLDNARPWGLTSTYPSSLRRRR
jgi:2-polyprenyl-3-methyl-5-hydroxy-6-metoxy-1,4-benzoquinol methylase